MPLALGDYARFTASLLYKGTDAIQNVFYIRNNNGDPASDDAVIACAEEFLEDIYGSIVSYLSEEVDFDFINVFIPTGDQALGNTVWPTLTAGTATGDVTAPGVSHLSYGRTGHSRSIGRKFWGAFSEAQINDGVWSAAQNAVCQLAAQKTWGTFVTTFGLSVQGVVYDRAAAQGRGVTSIVTTNIPAYQRRRRQGRGI